MNENEVVLYNSLNNVILDKENYTSSILDQALNRNLISMDTMTRIQVEIIDILKFLIDEYTYGENSSIQNEIAEQMMKSIYYTIDLVLLSHNNADAALNDLINTPIKNIYGEGILIITKDKDIAKQKLEELQRITVTVKEEYLSGYKNTVFIEIAELIGNFSYKFCSYEITTPTYPLAINEKAERGIRTLIKYIDSLLIEMYICNMFDEESSNEVLSNFKIQKGADFSIAYNIFEILLNNALFSTLYNDDPQKIVINDVEKQLIIKELGKLNINEKLDLFLDELISNLISIYQIRDSSMKKYISKYITTSLRLKVTSKIEELQKLDTSVISNLSEDDYQGLYKKVLDMGDIIITKQNFKKPNIVVNRSNRMKDKEFNKLLSAIAHCKDEDEIVKLIRNNITGISDLIDILKASSLTNSEFISIFSSLEDSEIAVLLDELYSLESADNNVGLYDIKTYSIRDDWERLLIDFVNELESDRKRKVQLFLDSIM